jgi:large repetitive protein
MKTSLKPITTLHRFRLGAIMIGSALTLALATAAFAAGPPQHSAPTAIAAISPTAAWQGDTLTLDASGSHTNPCCTALSFQWQQQAGPTVTLSPDISAVTATFIAPAVPLPALTQNVQFRIKVTDDLASGGDKNSFSTAVTTTVYAPPGADAEPKGAHVYEGTVVQLTGTPTRTQPGATFSYTWTAPAGITLSDVNAQNPTFTAPSVGPAGQVLTFTLVVTEHLNGLAHDKDSAPDSVTINIDNVNQPPTAYASANPDHMVDMSEVAENTDPVTLYASGSDPDGDALTFSWTQVHDTMGTPLRPGDMMVTLLDNTSATPTFTAPDLATQDHMDLVFRLIANDGLLNSGPSYVTIRVLNTNDPPVAVPSAMPASVFEGETVTLDGSQSHDPNMGDVLTYTWEQIGGTAVTLTPVGSNATFTAPVVSAMQGSITLDFQLTVSDGQLSDTKPISVTVSHVNLAPTADAGADQMVPEGMSACLDGSGSYDPEEGANVAFAWTQLDGPSVVLDNPNTSAPCFAAPDVGTGGATLHFQLTATDSLGFSNSDTAEVQVSYVNHLPTVEAGDAQTVNEGTTVQLNGSGADPDGNALIYEWTQLSGPAVTLSDASDPAATFTAAQVPCGGATVIMRLTVDDGYGGMVTDDVNINIANVNNPPTADAGMNQQVQESDLVSLHGVGTDIDGETLTFQWNQTSGPLLVLSPGSGQDVSFTAPNLGGGDPDAFVELGFSLTVMDTCDGSTTTLPITVHVANIPHAPVAVAQANPTSANEGGDIVQVDGSMSSDPDFDPLTYTWTQISGPAVMLVYSPGDTDHVMPSFATPWVSANTPLKFKLTVSDLYDGASDAYVTVTVINSHIPPDASHARADVGVLWPPDHKMAQVRILGVVNPNNDPVTIDAVTQDEPTNGLGDGDTPIDAIISGDSATLRAERSGSGNGRVYRICFTVHDPEQNAQGCVNVSVPKSKKTDVAVDNGQNYDSTH